MELDVKHLPHPYRRLGALYEQQGDRTKAIEYYDKFLELWEKADAHLQAQVDDVHRQVERLTSEEGNEYSGGRTRRKRWGGRNSTSGIIGWRMTTGGGCAGCGPGQYSAWWYMNELRLAYLGDTTRMGGEW